MFCIANFFFLCFIRKEGTTIQTSSSTSWLVIFALFCATRCLSCSKNTIMMRSKLKYNQIVGFQVTLYLCKMKREITKTFMNLNRVNLINMANTYLAHFYRQELFLWAKSWSGSHTDFESSRLFQSRNRIQTSFLVWNISILYQEM